jgi:SAM-dependent MidA family methyltransferase
LATDYVVTHMPQAKAAFAATALLAAHAAVRAADLPFLRGELLNPWEIHRELRVTAAAAPAVQELFLSFSQYQDLVLFHPTLGYYSSGRVSFTKDYRTFPDALSPYFGQMVAEHLFEMWQGMRKAGTLAVNEPFTIAEFGAGDGALAESILNYIDRRAADNPEARWREFARQTVYACYDRSAVLSAKQSQRNARFGARFEAREGDATDPTATIAAGSLKGVVLSNELPDAFSVHKVVLSPSGSAEVAFVAPALVRTAWNKLEKDLPAPLQESLKTEDRLIQTRLFGRKRETTTYLSREGFVALLEALSPARDYAAKLNAIEFREIYVPIEAVPELAEHLRRYIPAYAYQLARGDKGFAAYINLGEGRFIQGAGRILKAGYVITIDYGSNWDGVSPIEFDHLRTYGPGTRRERPDPYHSPTLNDITTDVNFSHLVEEGSLAGLRLAFFGSQHTLLTDTPIHLEFPPPERGALDKADLQDYQAWVQSFYTWDVFKVLVQQKENTDPAYVFPDPRSEPLSVHLENLTPEQQTAEREIERKLRERLAISNQ